MGGVNMQKKQTLYIAKKYSLIKQIINIRVNNGLNVYESKGMETEPNR